MAIKQTKQKPLKPSMREKKRYLLLKINDENIKRKDIEDIIIRYIGVLGYSKAGISWISDNILALNREMVNNVRASFVVGDKNIQVIKVSGTLKKLRI
jgi:RNase P/RNase MRP subunit POP5